MNSEFKVYLSTLEKLVGGQLHPIGWTNLLEDDGLGIFVDDSGRIFLDGGTGYEKPGNHRIDYLAATFDRALEILLGSTRKYDSWSGEPASGTWHYDEFD